MRKKRMLVATLALGLSTPGFAQLGALFQGAIENAAKQAVQQGVEQGVQQGVTQAVASAPTQGAAAPIVQNGCYYGLPPAPPSAQSFNPDLNGNGCVDRNEYATYLQVIQGAQANVTAQQPAAANTGSALGSALGGAMAVKNAGGTGNAAAWVAGQNALGAAANAARGQPAAAVNPADANGDGVATADEIANYQARIAAANGVTAVPAQAVNNATAEVVSGAVSGALKGLFGR